MPDRLARIQNSWRPRPYGHVLEKEHHKFHRKAVNHVQQGTESMTDHIPASGGAVISCVELLVL